MTPMVENAGRTVLFVELHFCKGNDRFGYEAYGVCI